MYVKTNTRIELMSSRPTTLRWTKAQEEAIIEIANRLGIPQSNVLRNALDWYLALTDYNQETMEMLRRVHPDMTPNGIIAWLMFQWRTKYEGKNGREEKMDRVEEKLDRLLRILEEKGAVNDSTVSEYGSNFSTVILLIRCSRQ
jgi:hypothetical protein